MENCGKQRIIIIDILKGMGMIMIVWAHAHGFLSTFALTLAIPLFFLISGYLHNTKISFLEFFKRKFLHLYIPFISCNLILPTIVTINRYLNNLPINENLLYIGKILLTIEKDGFLFGATWFLGNLFLISISIKLLDTLLKKINKKYILITTLCAAISLWAILTPQDITVGIRRLMTLPLFYAIGILIKLYSNNLNFLRNKVINITLVLVFLVLEFILIIKNSTLFTYEKTNIINYFIFITSSLLGGYILLKIGKLIENLKIQKIFSYIGENSIYILIWHFVFFEIITGILLSLNHIPLHLIEKFPHAVKTSGIWFAIYFLVGLIGPLAICKLHKTINNKHTSA